MKNRYPFKSKQSFYDKERNGIKPNTTREINLNEEKFLELIQHMMNGFDEEEIEIEIINADVGGSFIRDITDISIYNNLMIISWRHKGGKSEEFEP